MKNNEFVQTYILQAIKYCTDKNLSETKAYLKAALRSFEDVAKKQKRKNNDMQIEKQRKTQQDQWWEMIKQNAAKNIVISESENNPEGDI